MPQIMPSTAIFDCKPTSIAQKYWDHIIHSLYKNLFFPAKFRGRIIYEVGVYTSIYGNFIYTYNYHYLVTPSHLVYVLQMKL